MNIPVIRFEVEGMKHTLLTALSQHAAQIDAELQAAVKEFCKPENVAAVVKAQANQAIKQAVEQEITNFFSYGAGRTVIAEAVKKKLMDKPEY